MLGAGLLVACATQPTPTAYEPPGFMLGFVHALISPFALVAELFSVRVYAFPNSGGLRSWLHAWHLRTGRREPSRLNFRGYFAVAFPEFR